MDEENVKKILRFENIIFKNQKEVLLRRLHPRKNAQIITKKMIQNLNALKNSSMQIFQVQCRKIRLEKLNIF